MPNPILTSWRRCESLGLTPDRLEPPYREDLDVEDHLRRAAEPVLDRLEAGLTGTGLGVILADEDATVIDRRAEGRALTSHLDGVYLAPGFSYAEEVVGTNGIGTALVEGRSSYVSSIEHFADRLHPYVCAGAPIRDPLSGRIEGVIDLSCLRSAASPAMMDLARQAAGAIEQRLLEQHTDRERALVRSFFQSIRQAPAIVTAEPDPHGFRTPDDVILRTRGKLAINRSDEIKLREKAAELISLAVSTALEVRLSSGQAVLLVCRPVTTGTGTAGVVVEASFSEATFSALRRRYPATAGSLPPPPSAKTVPVQTRPERAAVQALAMAERTDRWLVLAGEVGVGQLALAARRRLQLLYDASVRIGTTLDVTRTAEELVEVAVPTFADHVTVDLPESVLRGDEPTGIPEEMRRVAGRCSAADDGSEPDRTGTGHPPVGYPPSSPQAGCLATGRPVVEPRPRSAAEGCGGGTAARSSEDGRRDEDGNRTHSIIATPLCAGGEILGIATFHRSAQPGAFDDDDLSLAEELVARASVCIDNARRYTREHAMTLALQQSLLPHGLPEQNAVEVAHRYLPARSGVGGDWFDVIPLSGSRVALVVGDVVGHGLHAAATMGRLRTAVHNFSALDLPVDELLGHLDDLVGRLDEETATEHFNRQIIGSTCLYAVYDPVSRRCTMGRAGHPAPALVQPDGTVDFLDLPAGPPLGLGGLPFETAEFEVAPGSQLVLYTDGLIEDRNRDIDIGLERLRHELARACGRSPEETCTALMTSILTSRPADDVALLVARTRVLEPHQFACWDVPADPAVVPRMRAAVTRQLEEWGLEEAAFTTELVTSEMVTNAIRHASGPIQIRLLRDRSLICEVSDTSSTSPRLRRASTTDENGRGLFLVAQLTRRWGVRYRPNGKVIWAEQPLPR